MTASDGAVIGGLAGKRTFKLRSENDEDLDMGSIPGIALRWESTGGEG